MRYLLNSQTSRLFAGLFLVFSFLAPAHAQGYCSDMVNKEIAQLKIPKERIKKTEIINVYDSSGQGGSNIDRVEGWVTFTDCKGNLVIVLNRFCQPQTNYTTYECKVPGVKSY